MDILKLLSFTIKLCIFCDPGSVTCPPGSPLGDGLTQEAAADLGLNPGTAVAASLIDAHAGGLGRTSDTCLPVKHLTTSSLQLARTAQVQAPLVK